MLVSKLGGWVAGWLVGWFVGEFVHLLFSVFATDKMHLSDGLCVLRQFYVLLHLEISHSINYLAQSQYADTGQTSLALTP